MQYVIYACNSQDCAVAAADGTACEWYVKELRCSVTGRSAIFQHGLHVTSTSTPTRPRLTRSMKRIIRELTEQSVKSSRILNRLIDTYNLGPAKTTGLLAQVQRYPANYRRTVLNDSDWIDVMRQLVSNNWYSDDLSVTASFAFGYDFDDDGNPRIGDGSADNPLVLGFAAKVTVRAMVHAATCILHVDATYKTNTCGYPVIVVGVSDAWRQFHPIAFFISSDAKEAQYEKALRALADLYTTVTGEPIAVKFVMADADHAQRNAFVSLLGSGSNQPEYLVCFYHVMANVKKYTTGMSVASRWIAYNHVYRIHYARNDVDLAARIQAALTEWGEIPECRAFRDRCEPQWLRGRLTKWYCIASPVGYAKTNNPVEQFNRAFKRDYTMRTLVSLNTLFGHLLLAASHYSVRVKAFQTVSRPLHDAIQRYKTLYNEDRLQVSLLYRNAVAFLIDEAAHARVSRVTQTSLDRQRVLPRTEGALHSTEYAIAEAAIETLDQPSIGWTVDVDNGTCGCRAILKDGHYVHHIAC